MKKLRKYGREVAANMVAGHMESIVELLEGEDCENRSLVLVMSTDGEASEMHTFSYDSPEVANKVVELCMSTCTEETNEEYFDDTEV